ncbi:LysR family transcriptional regulator [Nocardioides sp. LHD-245]|uniref:LysR family transcriptional regulator n=1 Tax=Nocardioides sp. LHD-245 TaxID=3051387 RepID=UPI0027E00D73|nr:LysR family transcriptional regulator [Nocardioides sp. LHD-245]
MPLVSDSLRYFLEVARTGSIAEASANLRIAASSISRHIARLEQSTGAPLFDRHPRGMVPTEAGRLLADHARRNLLEEADLLERIRDVDRSGRSLITVSCAEGFAEDFLPVEIARFREHHPAARVHLTVTEPAAATQSVAVGTADLALTFSLAPASGVRVAYSCQEPIVALVPSGHPLGELDGVSLADLQHHPLALMAGGSTLRELVDVCCAAEGLHLEPVLTSNSSTALNALARRTGAVTLTGLLSSRHLVADGFRIVPLTNPELHRRSLQVHTMAQRTLPAPVDAFVRQLVASIEATGLG